MSERKFKPGDVVKVRDDYATGHWLLSKDPVLYGPIPHQYRGKIGEVIEVNHDGTAFGLKIDGSNYYWFEERGLAPITIENMTLDKPLPDEA